MPFAYHEPMSRRRLLASLMSLLVLVGIAIQAESESVALPEFSMYTLDGSGSVSLENFKGRPILLTFWASWCGPCRVELPELEELYHELAGDGFVLLTVNVDTAPALAERFMNQIGVTIPVYRMNSQDLVALGINALPTNILIDKEGMAVRMYRGYSPVVPEEIKRLVNEMTETTDGQSPS